MVYKGVIIDITERQLKSAIAGKRVRFSASQLGSGTKTLYLHPENAAKVEKAVLKNAGVTLIFSEGELAETYAKMIQNGSGFFSNVWKGLKKVWGVLKDSGAASQLADMAVAPLSALTGQPALVGAARSGLKQLTGVGVKSRMTKSDKKSMLIARGLYLS